MGNYMAHTYTHMTRYKMFASVHTGESPQEGPSLHYILPVQKLHFTHTHIYTSVSNQWLCVRVQLFVSRHTSAGQCHILILFEVP